MSIKDQADILGLQRAGKFIADTLAEMKRRVRPGMTTAELDEIAGKRFRESGARSAPMLTYNFPGYTCISLNRAVAHGIPSEKNVIQAGDLINIDVSAELDGYFADTGHSFQVPPFTHEKSRLCRYTNTVLERVLSRVRAGMRINEIGRIVQQSAHDGGYTVIQNLAGHGTGRALHEEPSDIVSYHNPRDQRVLREGMVIAIEPFLSTGDHYVRQMNDGWTLTTSENAYAAQHEHTVIVTRGKPIVLTRRQAA